jgi:hypothetical protein
MVAGPKIRSNADIISETLKKSGVDSLRADRVAQSCVHGAKSPAFMTAEQKTILQTSFGKDLRSVGQRSPADIAGTAQSLNSAAYAPGSTIGFKPGGYKPVFGPTVISHDMGINGATPAPAPGKA